MGNSGPTKHEKATRPYLGTIRKKEKKDNKKNQSSLLKTSTGGCLPLIEERGVQNAQNPPTKGTEKMRGKELGHLYPLAPKTLPDSQCTLQGNRIVLVREFHRKILKWTPTKKKKCEQNLCIWEVRSTKVGSHGLEKKRGTPHGRI